MYESILKPILFRFDPEDVHDFFIASGEWAGKSAVLRKIFALSYGYRGPDISKVVDGIRYKTPALLSAGFDYNARLTRILSSFSYGGEEAGSITARPYEGNPKPRLTRLKKSQSILVNKGLKNDGVDKVIERLKAIPRVEDYVVGISIGRTNDPSTSSTAEGIEDYATSFRKLNEQKVGDYYAINISCPNAYGGESFTTPELLSLLLGKLRETPCEKPVYLKMPINLPWEKFNGLLEAAAQFKINGVVIGNLNKNYEDLDFREEAPEKYRGGLSGKPCFKLSNELIEKTKTKWGERFTIIGCGGILSPEDAMEKFRRGADLVQLITGMIYKGPGLVKEICEAYTKRVQGRENGFEKGKI
jgi:dihydroorotate dehydrogenase